MQIVTLPKELEITGAGYNLSDNAKSEISDYVKKAENNHENPSLRQAEEAPRQITQSEYWGKPELDRPIEAPSFDYPLFSYMAQNHSKKTYKVLQARGDFQTVIFKDLTGCRANMIVRAGNALRNSQTDSQANSSFYMQLMNIYGANGKAIVCDKYGIKTSGS